VSANAKLEHTTDGERRYIERLAAAHAQQFPIERALRSEQGDFHAIVLDDHAAAGGDEQETGGLAVEVGFDKGTGVDFRVGQEMRQRQGFEDAHGFGEFIDLASLAGGKVGRFQTAGVVFPLRLAAGIGGGGVGFESGLGQALEAGAELGADVVEEVGFHQRTARLAWLPEGRKIRRMPTIYVYQKCSTCRDALKWLDQKGIAREVKAIRETPPTPAELKVALTALGGNLRKLFNTSGVAYRELGMKDKLPGMSEAEAFGILSKNGNLVKRPFLIEGEKVLVGFKEAEWSAAFQA
jgi:arsenate reductase